MKGSHRIPQSKSVHSSESASVISPQPRLKRRAMGNASIKTSLARSALICVCFCAFSASGGDTSPSASGEKPIVAIWPLTYSTGRVKAIPGQVSLTSSQGSSTVTKDTIDQLVDTLNAIAAAEEKAASAAGTVSTNTSTQAAMPSASANTTTGTQTQSVTATFHQGTNVIILTVSIPASKETNTESKQENQTSKQADTVQYVRRVRNNLLITAKPKTVLKIKRLLTLLDAAWPQVQLDVFAFQASGCPDQVAEGTQAIRDHINKAKLAMRKAEKAIGETVRIWNVPPHLYKTDSVFQTLQTKCGFISTPHRELTLTEALTFLCLSETNIMSVLRQQLNKDLGSVDKHFAGREWKELDEVTTNDVTHARIAVEKFADDWRTFKNDETTLTATNACESLQQSSDVVDKLLRKVMDQYTTMVRTNLIAMVMPSLHDMEGVSLAGQCRIVVTSSLESGLVPTMASWAETTRAKPFSAEEMSTIMTAVIKSLATNGLDPTVLAPALKLLEQPEPVYTKVAPGIELHVRPTILTSAAEARLQIYARFGVKTEPDTTKSNAEKMPPAPTVESHEMATDAHIGIFDLFDISSFEITTSHPRAPFSIPFISRIPWLGVMFQVPLPNKKVKHVSIILVNAVIIPRAVNLLADYP